MFQELGIEVGFGLLREGRILAARIHRTLGFFHFVYFFFKNMFHAIGRISIGTVRFASLRDRAWAELSICAVLGYSEKRTFF